MLVLANPHDLKQYIGKPLGVSPWLAVDQERIDRFAEVTGDYEWIHVDVERAKRELPGGRTIAHGYLTLALIPLLSAQIYTIRDRTHGINYGLNRVRFTARVAVGSRIRLRLSCKQVEDVKPHGVRALFDNLIELEGNERPACVAETIVLAYGNSSTV